MFGTKRQDAHIFPDGTGSQITIKLPAKVHLAGLLLFLSLALVWMASDDQRLTSATRICTIIISFYALFYARRAIVSARERERRFETIKFSRVFSDEPLSTARESLSTRFRQIFNSQANGTDGEKHAASVRSLAEEMRQAMQARATPNAPPNQINDLVDEAIATLDYFEDLAVGIEEGVFDDITAQKLLKSPVLSFWDLHKGVAEQLRITTGRNTLYRNVEALYERWNKTR